MSTTTEETTVELTTENGSTGPIPMDEFNERIEEVADRLRGSQMSFGLVGGNEPNHRSLKLSADLSIDRDLKKGSQVKVVITDSYGELLASTEGKVVSVGFKDEYHEGYVIATDRIHTVKL